jgi:hypothetical protein
MHIENKKKLGNKNAIPRILLGLYCFRSSVFMVTVFTDNIFELFVWDEWVAENWMYLWCYWIVLISTLPIN